MKENSLAASTYYEATPLSLAAENNIGHLMRQTQTSLNRQIDMLVLPLDLTATQWRPLVLIRYRGVDTAVGLAKLTHTDTGAMTRTLDRLEAKGFILRQRCADDRRVVRLTLTPQGNQVAERILPVAANALNTHLTGFSNQEVQMLISMLHRMLANGQEANT
ncbi:MAG: MarR family transcriptional regulator [Burkholderiaceae bacterium]|nr:MarR family transcriptional regulator [Burkholderiaceae bacterium]